MSLINILLLENDGSFATSLKIALKKWSRVEVSIFKDLSGVLNYSDKHKVDLLIINSTIITTGDGIAITKKLSSDTAPLVFIADDENESVYEQARKFNPLAYLVKPFDFKTLFAAINSYFDDTQNFLIFKKGKETIRLLYRDIYWIKSAGNYCIIQTDRGEFSLKSSLTNLKQQYLDNNFIQIHRAFIIRIEKIEGVNTRLNKVEVRKERLPIGRKYRKAFIDRLEII